MVIKLRDNNRIVRKVMFYGKDGTGKSTNATKYCKAKGLNGIVLDMDDTYIDLPVMLPVYDLQTHTDTAAYNNIMQAIREVKDSSDFDTIIFDGIQNVPDMVTPKGDDKNFFKGRSKRWNNIMKELKRSNLNIIFIGQIDLYIEEPSKREEKSPKWAVALNAWVNEKYYCSMDHGKYNCIAEKLREVK